MAYVYDAENPRLGAQINAGVFGRVYRTNPMYDITIIRDLQNGIFAQNMNNQNVLTHAGVIHTANHLDVHQGDPVQETVLLAVCHDLYGPFPEARTDQRRIDAEMEYVRLMRIFMIQFVGPLPAFAVPEGVEPHLAMDAQKNAHVRQVNGQPRQYYLPHTYIDWYNYIEENIDAFNELLLIPAERDLISSVVVSVCHQGPCTTGLFNKIQSGIATDMGEAIELNKVIVDKFYHLFGRSITHENARDYFTRLHALIPIHCLRLSIVVQHASQRGLSGLHLVREALVRAPTFPWLLVEEYAPGEFQRFTQALTHWNHNDYLGFSRELGPAKASNYGVLVYTAKKILYACGMGTLRYYKGGAKGPFQKIDDAVNNYQGAGYALDENHQIIPPNENTPERAIYNQSLINFNAMVQAANAPAPDPQE